MTRIAHRKYRHWPLAILLVAVFCAASARADVDLRAQVRPITDPIQAFIRVTDQNGAPVSGLTSADFSAAIDGTPLPAFTFTLPPDQDPTQRISIVFAIDYSTSVQDLFADAIRDGVSSFINQMAVGDYAAIIKFNATNPAGASVVQEFTRIDGGAGTSMLVSAVAAPYPGEGTNLFDAMILAVDQFVAPPVALPNGPKAIVLIGDGEDNSSAQTQSDVVAHANDNGIPVFTVSVGDISGDPAATALMASLAEDTGGHYFAGPSEEEIAEAYVTLAGLLNNAYLLTIPQTAVTDCSEHSLDVTADGQAASLLFVRCDRTPDDFHFFDEPGVAPGSVVVSNTVSITGIDGDTPVEISVTGGEYSIGCSATFTSAPGIIEFEDEVCVRHTASANFSTSSAPTVLVVGGVSSSFTSTTQAAPPPGNGGGGSGGGGATGMIELLLGFAALLARRRRRI